jgi:hypothetical protein
MARVGDSWETEQWKKRKKTEEAAKIQRENDFVQRWKNASEEERARILIEALNQKADNRHNHGSGLIGSV